MEKPFNGAAQWIWSCEGTGLRPSGHTDEYRVRFFHRTFLSLGRDNQLIVHVSADSRYILWFNGHLIGRGPARGDIEHHFYDTYDLTPRLRGDGANVLAAQVIYCGDVMPNFKTSGAPCGLMTAAPGFIVDGALTDSDGNVVECLHTDKRWKVFSDAGALRHAACEGQSNYTGLTERFHGKHYPWGWNIETAHPKGFEPATEIFRGDRPDTVRDTVMPHRLIPRPIPFLEATPQPFAEVISGHKEWNALIRDGQTLQIPPHSAKTAILALPTLTTAFPRLQYSGGAEARIRLTYAEALSRDGVKQHCLAPGGDVVGLFDEIICGGGEQEQWESWHYRTFRYFKIEIETQREPLVIQGIDSVFWAYPFNLQASFECDDPFYSLLFDVGFRTLRLCSHETYEDCPYYEQLSYAGDNYVTGQLAALLTGDSRLTSHTLRQFNWSRNSEGLTKSRYPCRVPQIIPAWSQLWLLTCHVHYWATGDLAPIKEVLDGISSVITWFERRREDDGEGLVGKLSYWCILDLSPDWGVGTEESGVPPGSTTEASAANNFLHIWCLRAAGELFEACGQTENAIWHRRRADELSLLAHRAFWENERGAYRDRRSELELSQLTNALAILSEATPRHLWRLLTPRLTDPSLCRAGYFGEHFVFDALAKAGEFGQCWEKYHVYRDLLERQGNTTLPEIPSPQRRSECHAWSTGCVYHLLANGLGVQPGMPGYRTIRIAPQPGPLRWLRGVVPTPQGEISVELRQTNGNWALKANTPANIPVLIQMPGQIEQVFPRGGAIEIS